MDDGGQKTASISPMKYGGSSQDQKGRAAVSFASSLSFESVNHSFGRFSALKDVTLDIEPGEIMCLLGPSGCGKSTLLRIAAGVERPQSGRVLLNGLEIAGPSSFVQPENRGIGLVFQDFALFPHLSILKNVMFGLNRLGRDDATKAAQAALKRVGLLEDAEKYCHMLSGGEQQRVALARALAPRPAVLLMDEPFSGLDKRLRDQVRAETLEVLREAQITCVFVTHDPEEALRVADRIALMREGQLVQLGKPDQLYKAPRDLASARFFSEINELPGDCLDGKVATAIGTFPVDSRTLNGLVRLCFRPQSVELCQAHDDILQGTVLSRQYIGDADLLEIRIDGCEQPILARSTKDHARSGEKVGVQIRPEDLIVFPSD